MNGVTLRTVAKFSAVTVLLLWTSISRNARAQVNEAPSVTRAVAIERARIVQAPGQVIERGTVVVRDGLIEAVGPNVEVPYDAERIAGDSLTVYAGFIDGLSHVGIPEPEDDDENNREEVERPGDPPNDRAGIQPQRDARTLLTPDAETIGTLRQLGFTVAHVVPHGRMLPGSGAVVLLTGDAPNEMVLRGDASLFVQFEGARRMYPATDMAILAKLRQLYREAERRQRIETFYAANPAGLERPDYDPVHYAFFPVLDGEKPIFFHTEEALDVHRVLDARDELGFPLALTGLNQSFDAVEALTAADVPLFLTLDLPKPDTTDADSTDAAIRSDPGSFFESNLRTRSYEDTEAEEKNLKARQALEREKYYATAATLREAGLRFGFTTIDVKPDDIRANLRTMIEHGLSEEDALAALTTDAVELLGLAQSLGTVEEGKLANLVITTGPVFDEKSTIRYVFVDGHKFEVEAEDNSEENNDEDPGRR